MTERVLPVIAPLMVLSLAPSILVMMTSFTRVVVAMSLRTSLGTASAPPNTVIVSLPLFLSAFVMVPVPQKAYDAGVEPLLVHQIATAQVFERVNQPFHAFMQ